MATANLDDLGGIIGEVIGEVRGFADSWDMAGLHITGEVLRADHPTWRQYGLDFEASRPEARQSRELVHERLLNPLAPKGFRQSKKLSEPEAHRRLVGKVAGLERLQIDVFRLREQKPGIAEILCKSLVVNGEPVAKRRGEHDLTTAAGRASFMDHRLWEVEMDGMQKEICVPFYQTNADGAVILDDDGEPIKNDFGGWNLGDAMAALIVQEAEDLPRFVEARKADALEVSGDRSIGPSESGSASTSIDAES